MKFGIREVANMTFKRISGVGPTEFTIDTAKTSTLESASTTVYAQGGQGNSRLMAWEGEKTLTFTVEDALLTMESFWALTGAKKEYNRTKGMTFKVYPTSFAGYYEITADTLFRNELGEDHDAKIYIPKAKLQTNLNLGMSPTGDPSTFTFTFDAFPSEKIQDNKMLFSLEVNNTNDYAITDIEGNNERDEVPNWQQVRIIGEDGTTIFETPVLSYIDLMFINASFEPIDATESEWEMIAAELCISGTAFDDYDVYEDSYDLMDFGWEACTITNFKEAVSHDTLRPDMSDYEFNSLSPGLNTFYIIDNNN